MAISLDAQSPIFMNTHGQIARGLNRTVQGHELSLTPEQTKEANQESFSLSIQRHLSPEEEKRVQFLKDTLSQLLTLSDGQPTEEQKARIREIEKELEDITGVKMRSRIANATDKMLGEEDEKEETLHQLDGTAPEDAIHTKGIDTEKKPMNPALTAIRNNALCTRLRTLFGDSETGFTKPMT